MTHDSATQVPAQSSSGAVELASIDLLATQPIDMIQLLDQKPPDHP